MFWGLIIIAIVLLCYFLYEQFLKESFTLNYTELSKQEKKEEHKYSDSTKYLRTEKEQKNSYDPIKMENPQEPVSVQENKPKVFKLGAQYLQSDGERSKWVTYQQKLITPESLNKQGCYAASKYDGFNRI